MNTSGKTSSNSRSSHRQNPKRQKPSKWAFFRRLDIRFPWFKLITACVIGVLAILDLCDLTISSTNDPVNKIMIAPMSRHIQATERVTEGKKLVALTFDDGPSPTTTPRLLDILAEKDVPATFFMLGSMARNNPDIVKRAKREWHEVASHTMYHQNLIKLPTASIQSDISEAKSVFKSILGYSTMLTRPPYGNVNDDVKTIVAAPMILWSVDTEDWKNKNTDSIVSITMSEVYDGAIILMHDIYPTSVEAVPTLVETLRQNGYEFVTVPELAKERGVELSPGKIYYSFRP